MEYAAFIITMTFQWIMASKHVKGVGRVEYILSCNFTTVLLLLVFWGINSTMVRYFGG